MLSWAAAIFFASGFAALLYQVAWQRMLVIFSGADVYAATIVVAAFMAGLGCGSAAGGYVADRVSRVNSLVLFALAELAVAAFGLASKALFYDVLYTRLGDVGIGLGPTAALLLVALFWPTFFMGVSLPLLARGLTTDVGRAASTVGWLYAANTLGAATGALWGAWSLLPQFGLEGSVRVAAIINLACAAAVVLLVFLRNHARVDVRGDDPFGSGLSRTPPAALGLSGTPPVQAVDSRATGSLTLTAWAAIYALAGFIALSFEIVWFRMLSVMLKSTAFTFGTLLGLYLSGLGLGAALGSVAAPRIRRPALGFFALQIGAALYAAASLTAFVAHLADPTSWYTVYFSGYDPIDIKGAIVDLRSGGGVPWDFVRLYVLLPAALIGPPTVMTGFSFPLLQRVVQTDLLQVGRRAGTVIAANILGSTLGALLTGPVLLHLLGTAGTLKLLVVASGVSPLFVWRHLLRTQGSRIVVATGAGSAVALLTIAAITPGPRSMWAALHGTVSRNIIMSEDASGVSVLKGEQGNFRRVGVFVNGLGQSWIPYGGIHTALGALPAFVHPNPRTAALIGLGSGDTLFAIAGRRELQRITSIEIVRPQIDTLREFARIQGAGEVLKTLDDPRVEHVFGDGRLHIRRARRTFDIIEADALRPTSAYSGNLYSDAYFELLRDHLNPRGLAVTWAPTERIARTFVKVFPYVWAHHQIMIGSNEPIEMDRAAIAGRLSDSWVTDYYAWAGVNIEELLATYIGEGALTYGPADQRSHLVDINTDLYPKDEFDIPPLIGRPRER